MCRLYGRWDRTFGCWLDTAEGLVPFQVNEPVLARHGLWFEPEGRRDDDWYASRTAIAAYFSLIPRPIRCLVAPYGNRQWELLEAIWRDPAAARTLDI